MQLGGKTHLTYCTNVHPGESWDEVRSSLERFVPEVKERVRPEGSFGLGLRLSARAARSLESPGRLAAFVDLLHAHDLYVFTINGFPYGAFHGRPVKQDVYRPDWRDERRLRYSNSLARLLARLLPGPEIEGSVSTVPGAFGPDVRSEAEVRSMADRILRHAAVLHALRERRGRTISLAIEPEPCCFLETIDQAVRFFEEHLFSEQAVRRMTGLTGASRPESEEALRRHLGVCLDTCHAAVEYEEPARAVARLRSAGIGIKKLQLSAGLRVPAVDRTGVDALEPFQDAVYLHQVIWRRGSVLRRYPDLPEAVQAFGSGRGEADGEWRIHFHVPIFVERFERFESTQPFLREILALHAREPLSSHLEVETYTWEVLPGMLRGGSVTSAVARELSWVVDRLEEAGPEQAPGPGEQRTSLSG